MKTRRQFLSDLGCGLGTAAFLSTFDRFSRLEAAAAPSGYKALVCVFLFGGNDGNNTRHPVRRLRHVPEGPRHVPQHPEGLPPEGLGGEPEGRLRPPPGARRDPPALRQGAARRPRERRPPRGAAHAGRSTPRRAPPREPLLAQRPAGALAVVRRVEGGRRSPGRAGADGRPTPSPGSTPSSFPAVVSTSGPTLFGTGERASKPLVPGTSLSGFGTDAASTARYAALRKSPRRLETGACSPTRRAPSPPTASTTSTPRPRPSRKRRR